MIARLMLISLSWAYAMCAGIAYANWCRPAALDCVVVLPIWGLSGLVFFGLAVVPLELIIVALMQKAPTFRPLLKIKYVALIFVAQVLLGVLVGDVLAKRFGIGAP